VFLFGKSLHKELLNAEKNLNFVLQDINLDQTAVVLHQLHKNSADLKTLMEYFKNKTSLAHPFESTKQTDDVLARLATRLNYLLAQAPNWKKVTRNTESEALLLLMLERIRHSVEEVSRIVDEEDLDPQQYIKAMEMELLTLMNAEKRLNDVIQVDDSAVIIDQIKRNSDNLKELLDGFVLMHKSSNNPALTSEQEIRTTLAGCYAENDDFLSAATPFTINDPTDLSWGVLNNYAPFYIDRDKLVFSTGRKRKSLIGKGGFAKIYSGSYYDLPVAVKVFETNLDDETVTKEEWKHEVDLVVSETQIMMQCCIHPNIVEVIGCYLPADHVSSPLMVMELLDCDLYKLLHRNHQGKLPQLCNKDCLELMIDIGQALAFLHLQGIVHQDVKSLNILVDVHKMVAKLTDFGETQVKGLKTTCQHYANISCKRTGKQLAGMLSYQAPEILS
jgi:tRNA A-37 threonylcarbamoyl transferase component Bud32